MSKTPIELTVDSQQLRGNLYVPDSHRKNIGVLFLHGWTGKPNEAAAEELVVHGYTVLTISLRGHNN